MDASYAATALTSTDIGLRFKHPEYRGGENFLLPARFLALIRLRVVAGDLDLQAKRLILTRPNKNPAIY